MHAIPLRVCSERWIFALLKSFAWHVRQSSSTASGCMSENAWGIVVLPPPRRNMGLRRTVAALAAGALGRHVPHGNALEVGILVEVTPDIGVTGFADVASEIMIHLRGRSGRRRLGRGLREGAEG